MCKSSLRWGTEWAGVPACKERTNKQTRAIGLLENTKVFQLLLIPLTSFFKSPGTYFSKFIIIIIIYLFFTTYIYIFFLFFLFIIIFPRELILIKC